MAYATYITDALVCGTKDSNTSDKSFLLFTREAGMLFANARSVRMEKSKQRYALQEFALVRATLIKGKSGWRIGSVETKENFYHMAVDKPARGSVVRIFRQLRRFIHGEEAAPTLFDFVVQALELVASDHTHRSFIDSTVHLHLMSLLGYVAKKDMPEAIKELDFATISNQFTESLQTDTEQLLTHAVKVSQL